MIGNLLSVLLGLWLAYSAIFANPPGDMNIAALAAGAVAVIAFAAWARQTDPMRWPSGTIWCSARCFWSLQRRAGRLMRRRPYLSGFSCLLESQSPSWRCGRCSTGRIRGAPTYRPSRGARLCPPALARPSTSPSFRAETQAALYAWLNWSRTPGSRKMIGKPSSSFCQNNITYEMPCGRAGMLALKFVLDLQRPIGFRRCEGWN